MIQNFNYCLAPMMGILDTPLALKIAHWPIFNINFSCTALHYALYLNYLILLEKNDKD